MLKDGGTTRETIWWPCPLGRLRAVVALLRWTVKAKGDGPKGSHVVRPNGTKL